MLKKIVPLSQVEGECYICECKRMLQLSEIHETLTFKDENINVVTQGYYCPEGDHYFFDIEDEEKKFQKAYVEYRRRKGFLQPEAIKKIRKKYGLSQKEFATFLGFGKITIHRYETGAVQDSAHNSALFLISETEGFRKLFEQRRKSLPLNLVGKIEARLDDMKAEEQQLALTLAFRDKDISPTVVSSQLRKSPLWTKKKDYQVVSSERCDNMGDGELAYAA